MNYPKITEVLENKREAKDVKTLTFKNLFQTIPGQFYMIWIPEIDEIPMGVSYITEEIKGFTYRNIGEATKALYILKKGDKIGIRGPYGNGFEIKGNHILFVGGGTGIAMLAPAIEESIIKNIRTTVIIGVKTKSELFFEKRLKIYGTEVIITSDDGSIGEKGLASDVARKIIENDGIDSVITCGPELMMKKLLNYCENISFQASLERFMKCAIGLCGQCCIGNGIRVCKEGPIFNGELLKNINDFGKYKRDASGKKVYF